MIVRRAAAKLRALHLPRPLDGRFTEVIALQEIDSFRLPSGTTLAKVSPLARWTTSDVRDYAKAHRIPLLPLYDAGYTSIGCEPCTEVPSDPLNPRSGRWQGQKLECGIHIQAK